MASAQSERPQGVPGNAANEQQKKNPLDAEFEKFALAKLEAWHVPGMSIAVVDGDETWSAGYGHATLPSTPATASTLYMAGSTTKAFTAAVLSLLIDEADMAYPVLNERGWRTPLASLIHDDFVLAPERAWEQDHLTLEDLLSHRTGFPRHDKSLATHYGEKKTKKKQQEKKDPESSASTNTNGNSNSSSVGGKNDGEEEEEEDVGDYHRATPRDFARSLRHLPMTGEPRAAYRYCNLMFLVAGHAIETVAGGQPLGELMRKRIWAPLGMEATFFSREEAVAAPEHLAAGYWWDHFGGNADADAATVGGGYHDIPPMSLVEAGGAGGVVSCVADYARWLRCLVDGAAPLSAAGHKAVTTPRTAAARPGLGFDAPSAYALGWYADTYRGHRVFSHGGGMEAYGAEVFFFPGLRYAVVAMGNTAVTSNFAGRELLWKLINDRLDVPEAERHDWNGRHTRAMDDIKQRFVKPEEKLYPNRADPPLPHTLPLEAYTGTYFHPGYRHINVELSHIDGQLRALRKDVAWQMKFDFVHVSSEYWVIYIDMLNSPNLLNGQVAKAEFRVSVNGKVDELVVEFMEDGSEGVVTFHRVA